MRGLRVSPKLTLPVELVGESTAILAKKGAGKSNTAKTYLSTLRRNGLIEIHGSAVRASDTLFIGGSNA